MPESNPLKSSTHGRCLSGDLPSDQDPLVHIEDLCSQANLKSAVFQIFGSVKHATIGVYDQQQQVYVTHREVHATEILSLKGQISQSNGKFRIRAWVGLADKQGQVCGGRLFTTTCIYQGAYIIEELMTSDNSPPIV